MIVVYCALAFLLIASWLLSLLAAFMLGGAALMKQQAAQKAVIVHDLRNVWESFLLTLDRRKHNAAASTEHAESATKPARKRKPRAVQG